MHFCTLKIVIIEMARKNINLPPLKKYKKDLGIKSMKWRAKRSYNVIMSVSAWKT